MRILSLHFKNINSLEGENLVDFEQAPFSEAGVFAITGPNGSGKSSILDVITLGLYGETFRFNRPAEHVMTQQTSECFAAIVFSVDGEKYKSTWRVQRVEGSATRELMAPQMQIVRLSDETVLAATATQVCAQVMEITGMNFRNFTRSVLLAQGDFSAFLNALDSERMDILEKIISGDIYADYKQEVLAKADAAQQQLDTLKAQLSTIQLLPPEKQEANELDLIDFKEQLSELNTQKTTLTQQHDVLMSISALKKQMTAQEEYLLNLQQQIDERQGVLDQFIQGQDVLLFKDAIDEINHKKEALQQGRTALSELQKELKFLKEQLSQVDLAIDTIPQKTFADQQKTLESVKGLLNQYSFNSQSETEHLQSLIVQAIEKDNTLATVSAWLDAHKLDEVLVTDLPEIGKLKKLRAEVSDLKGQLKAFSKQSKKTSSALKNSSAAILKEQHKQEILKQQISADEAAMLELSQGNTLEEWDALRIEQQDRVKDFQALYLLGLKHQKLAGSTGFFAWFKRKEQPEYDAERLELELEKLKHDMQREENIRLTLQQAVVYEGLLKKMAPDRVHLIHGKPCALCGGLQHPYAKFPPVISNSKQALIDQKVKIRQLKEQTAQVTFDINAAKKQSEGNKNKQAQRVQIRAEWLTLCNRLNSASRDLTIDNVELMKELLKQSSDDHDEILNLALKIRGKQLSIEKAQAAITKSVSTLELLQANTEQLGANNAGISQEELDLETAVTRRQEQEKELVDKILVPLTYLGEKLPGKGQEDVLFDRLNSRRQEYLSYSTRYKSLLEERALLDTKQATSQNEITQCSQQIESYTQQLKKEEAVGLHLGLIEKQRLIADKEQSLAQLELELATLQKGLEEKIAGSQWQSVSDITQFFARLEKQPELAREQARLIKTFDTKVLELEATENELNEAYAKSAETLLNSLEIEQRYKEVFEKLTITQMEVEHLERLLTEHAQLKTLHTELTAKLQQHELASQTYFAEATLIKAESGVDFRKRVQHQLADKLVSQTNAILEKISGRYYLRQAHSELGLALEIEDTYQANLRRLPKSLSGGESFVVSLALALGLSELANNGRSVDSLFLDEGFGNLDADSLYTVISTLENLHTQGKTVGVISHVDAIQKRFKAQLQVVKKPNGLGELRQAS